jgi:hypothetical protein
MNATRESFVKKLVKQNWIGLTIIFTIPIILFFVFYVSSNIKEMLILHRDYSNIYDVFTTNGNICILCDTFYRFDESEKGQSLARELGFPLFLCPPPKQAISKNIKPHKINSKQRD